MFSLCGGRDKSAEETSGEEPRVDGSDAYRPGRGLAREMIDEQAMAPSGQVEVPQGTPRSNFSVGGRRAGAPVA